MEITPDTDTDQSQEQMKHHQIMMPPCGPTSNSFKRAPVMGNRGLETRNSKRTSQRKTPPSGPPISSSPPIQHPVVGALEVQNVKRAINRYGTLPKGARIGAYLESLRQNSEVGSRSPPQSHTTNGNILNDPSIAPPLNLSPRTALKVQPQMIRSNSSGGVTMTNSATASLTKLQRHRTTTDGTMMTFSSFRSTGSNNSPKRSVQAPALADLEFPPPPLDLPPPPEEFDVPNIPTLTKVQCTNNDVSNTAPSVKEASTRFGVNLRKREPSTDSCSSLGSPANDLNEPSILNKSPLSSYNDVPKTDPASMLLGELAETMHLKKDIESITPTSKAASVDVIRKPNSTPKPDLPPANGIPFKAQLKKVEQKKFNKDPPKDEIMISIIDFKSRLRKVTESDTSTTGDADDKSDNKLISDELTNNNNNKTKPNTISMPPSTQPNGKKTEIKIDVVSSEDKSTPVGASSGDDEDKRKSTGSISSLKKLWEAKEFHVPIADGLQQNNQLSPKLAMKLVSGKKDEHHDDNHNSTINGHHDTNFIEPSVAKKPAVPMKPTKFTIYATPIQQMQSSKVIENTTASNLVASAISSASNSSPGSRENILEMVQMAECNLKIPVNLISASQWLQLSDKLNVIQLSCVNYADTEQMPPHTKFQFRELVTRVENQSNCLRSAGQKNVQENERLLIEVGQSLKQLSNALHR